MRWRTGVSDLLIIAHIVSWLNLYAKSIHLSYMSWTNAYKLVGSTFLFMCFYFALVLLNLYLKSIIMSREV